MLISTYLKTPLVRLTGAVSLALAGVVSANQEPTLETILVTGQPLNKAFEVNAGAFGAKNMLDIPISIQSIDAETIKALSPRTAIDVLSFDASIQSASYGASFDNYRLRGFAMDNFNTVRRDGLSLAPHHDFALENVERIDVLKGPSGFLYGFNSPGGSINYLLKRPTKDAFADVSVQGTSLDGKYAAFDASSSVADGRFGYRVNLAYEKIGDFDHAGDLERKLIGVATDFRISDSSLLQVNLDWSEKSNTADPLLRADQSSRSNPLDPNSYILPVEVDRRDLLTGSWYRHNTEGINVDAKLEMTLANDWVWVNQGNFSEVERYGGYTDLFNIQANGDIGYADLYNSRGEIFTVASLQSYFAGQLDTGSVGHDLFIGISTKEFKDESPFWDFVDSTGDNSVADISVGNVLNPVQPDEWDFGPKQAIEFESKIQEHSIFASDLIAFNDTYELLLGARYIWYSAENLGASALTQENNVFVPSVALIAHPTDNAMAYVSYSRGFEKGDIAPFHANNANEPTDAIESEQWELGYKVDINRSFNAGIAIFDIQRDASYVNADNYFVDDGQYTHRGVELNVAGQVSQALSLTANTAYLSTELSGVADPTTEGKRTEGVPEWSAGVRAVYAFASIPGLSLDGTVQYVGSRPIDAQNSGFIPAYTVFDAGVSYEFQNLDSPITLRLLGKNLTDKYYYAGAMYIGGLEVGRAREILLSADIRF